VIGAPNSRGDDTVKAFVILKEGQTATADEIIAFCRERLTRYKAPRLVEFRDELPKTLIGKHLRRVLVKEEQDKLEAAHNEEAGEVLTGAGTATEVKPAKKGWRFPAGITRMRS
jgi:long-chain acyl-CoA synthetase